MLDTQEGELVTFAFPAYHTERYSAGTGRSSDLRAGVHAALQALAWGIEVEESARIVASSNLNVYTWGERISVDFLPDDSVSITSKCALPTQCFDWGKNKANVVRLMTEIRKHVVASSALAPGTGSKLARYCTSCGKPGVEGMRFCPRCGKRLAGSDPYVQPSYVSQPEASLIRRNWFERHLNWTMVLAWAAAWLLTPLAWLVNGRYSAIAGILVLYAVSIAVGSWVLRKKNRSMWWLLLCGGVLFLFIGNKSPVAGCNETVKLELGGADGYIGRGDAYAETSEYAKAIADYTKAIELDPRQELAYFNRAYAYGETGDYDMAIADYSKAIELAPADAQAYYNRGLDYLNKGEVPQAVSDLEKAVELSADAELTEDAQKALCRLRSAS